MLDCRVQGVLLTVGDRINRRIENFRASFNESDETTITKDDFNEIMRAIQKMVNKEVSGVFKRRGM